MALLCPDISDPIRDSKMKAPNIAKKYIKCKQTLRDFECTVCLDIDPNVRRCSGPCKAAICLRCATYISQNSKNLSCPRRCSNKLVLQLIPQLKIEFLCPFGGEKCHKTIIGMQAFAEHKCEYMSQQALQAQMQRQEHVCHKGHPLVYIKRKNHECADCGQKRLCSSICQVCSTKDKFILFCHDCRALPCTKTQCPFGHKLEKVSVTNKNIYCDLCGFCIILFSDHCYNDKKCFLDICGLCLQKLPDQNHLIPIQRNTKRYQGENKKENTGKKQAQQHFFDVDFDGSSFQEFRSDQDENQEVYNEWMVNNNQINQEMQHQDVQQDYLFDEFGQQMNIPQEDYLNAYDFDEDLDNLQNEYANWLL